MMLASTGHQNIPSSAVEFVRAEIAWVLAQAARPLIGVCSLAAGADQMFAEAVLIEGGELHAIVPSEGYERTFDEVQRAAYRGLLERASESETLNYREPSEEAFLAAGMRAVDICDELLAVWDGTPARGRGGTADVVAYAQQQGKPLQTIWPEGVVR